MHFLYHYLLNLLPSVLKSLLIVLGTSEENALWVLESAGVRITASRYPHPLDNSIELPTLTTPTMTAVSLSLLSLGKILLSEGFQPGNRCLNATDFVGNVWPLRYSDTCVPCAKPYLPRLDVLQSRTLSASTVKGLL